MKKRSSNIELYRILAMLAIVAHHYFVHSGLWDEVFSNMPSAKSIYLMILGAWGKTGINCFVLITGFFMCNSNITIKKWVNLMCEIIFYNVAIYLIFVSCGYETFSSEDFLEALMPIRNISSGFYSCYLVFYLFIPFLNILIRNINEKQYLILLALCIGVYSIWGSNPFITLSMNYVSWFMVIYLIGAYIRIYPKKIFENCRLWATLTLLLMLIAITSFLILSRLGHETYFLVADSNKILAVLISVTSFILFANMPVNYNKYINMVGKSTFGVLLIHTSCSAMLTWLWNDILQTEKMFYSSSIYIHSIISVVGVFAICSIIDIIRSKVICFIRKKINTHFVYKCSK